MYTVYEVNGGFGYIVETDSARIVQEHNPFRTGRVLMTEAEATYFATCISTGVEIEYEGDVPPDVPPSEPHVDRISQLEQELALTQGALNELIMLVLGGGE